MQYLSLQQGAAKVLRLTQHMLSSAKKDDWQRVVSIESERQYSIDSLFRHPDLGQALPELAEILRQVIALDQECIGLGATLRLQLSHELNLQSQGERALRAYATHTLLE